MPLSQRHRGWDWDPANSRLNVVIDGTIVAYFDDATADLTLANANGLSGGTVSTSTPVGLDDDVSIEMGDGDDAGLHMRSTALTTPWAIADVTLGTEVIADVPANSLLYWNITADGDHVWLANNGGNTLEFMRIDASAKAVIFNEASSDIDFRVESDGQTHAIFVEGSTDRVGIFNSAPDVALDLTGAFTASGIIKTDDGTDATSTTDGSLQTDGGISLVKDIWIGAKTNCVGLVEFQTGGTVGQITSKATGVDQNSARSGNIVTHNASLADDTVVSFIVSADQVTAADVITVNHANGGTAGAYQVGIHTVGSSVFSISIRNISGGALGEAIDLQWTAIRATVS